MVENQKNLLCGTELPAQSRGDFAVLALALLESTSEEQGILEYARLHIVHSRK